MQPSKALLDAVAYSGGRPVLVGSAPGVEPRSHLGGDNEIVFVFEAGKRSAEARFGVAAGIARPCIKERDAVLDRCMNEPDGFRLVEDPLAPKAGAAEPNLRHAQARASKAAVEH